MSGVTSPKPDLQSWRRSTRPPEQANHKTSSGQIVEINQPGQEKVAAMVLAWSEFIQCGWQWLVCCSQTAAHRMVVELSLTVAEKLLGTQEIRYSLSLSSTGSEKGAFCRVVPWSVSFCVLGRSTSCITLDPVENSELITRLQDGDDPIEQYL
jgi:hypothetical protein